MFNVTDWNSRGQISITLERALLIGLKVGAPQRTVVHPVTDEPLGLIPGDLGLPRLVGGHARV